MKRLNPISGWRYNLFNSFDHALKKRDLNFDLIWDEALLKWDVNTLRLLYKYGRETAGKSLSQPAGV